jgi:hypothetical protein
MATPVINVFGQTAELVERQLNRIRTFAVAALFFMEQINYRGLHFGPFNIDRIDDLTPEFHAKMSYILVAWVLLTWALNLMMKVGLYRSFFSYYIGAIDLLALSGVLFYADGPASPVNQIYFVLMALAFLRADFKFLWVSFTAILAAYISLSVIVPVSRPETDVPFYKIFLFVLTLSSIAVSFHLGLRSLTNRKGGRS